MNNKKWEENKAEEGNKTKKKPQTHGIASVRTTYHMLFRLEGGGGDDAAPRRAWLSTPASTTLNWIWEDGWLKF